METVAGQVGEGGEALVCVGRATGSCAGEKRFRTAGEAARVAVGQPDLHFHDLRHAGGVLYAHTGATLRELMDWLGHTSPNMAMRYQHTAEGRTAELADKLSALAATNP